MVASVGSANGDDEGWSRCGALVSAAEHEYHAMAGPRGHHPWG
jgi:hypothetical protein